jgi:hypothetical protein
VILWSSWDIMAVAVCPRKRLIITLRGTSTPKKQNNLSDKSLIFSFLFYLAHPNISSQIHFAIF